MARQDISRRNLLLALCAAGLLFCLFLYLLIVVDTRTVYISLTLLPPFSTGIDFLGRFLPRPGGLLEYAAAFLSQYFFFAAAGAVIAAVHVFLMALAARATAGAAGLRGTLAGALPAFLAVILYGRYEYRLNIGLGILAALASFLLYRRMTRRLTPHSSAAVFLACSAVVYYVTGGSLLLFGLLCALLELLGRRRIGPGLCCLLWTAALPLATGFLLQMNPTDAFLCNLPFHPGIARKEESFSRILYALLFLSFPAAVAAGEIGPPFFLRERLPAGRARIAVSLLMGMIGVLAAAVSLDRQMRTELRIVYFAERGMWREMLREADGYRRRTGRDFRSFHVLRAMLHAGRLSSSPVSFYSMSFLDGLMSEVPVLFTLDIGDIYCEMGRVNEAEHAYFERYVLSGAHPTLAKRIARTMLIRGQPEGAKVFLRSLERDLIWAPWARRYLLAIERGEPYPEEDIERIRALMPLKDSILRFDGDAYFLDLLVANRHNQLAFEFLMTYYLMTGNLDGFVRNLPRMDDFDYRGMPRLYEEAVLLHQHITGARIALPGRLISEEAARRFEDFKQDMALAGPDFQARIAIATNNYPGSYFTYHLVMFEKPRDPDRAP